MNNRYFPFRCPWPPGSFDIPEDARKFIPGLDDQQIDVTTIQDINDYYAEASAEKRHRLDTLAEHTNRMHAAAIRDLKRRLKADFEQRVDDAVQRLWARLHPGEQLPPEGE